VTSLEHREALLGANPEPKRLGSTATAATAFGATFVAVLALLQHGLGPRGLIDAFVCAVLVVLSVIDIDRRLLPNRIVLPSAAVVLAAQLAFFPEHWLAWVGASFGAATLFGLAYLLYPAGLGMGDVKLALLLGAALGTQTLTAVMLGTLAAGIFGVALIVHRGGSARKTAIPFGPFLAAGAVLVLLAG
jgi:leader peptidase (prepilin peptidase) / N-methyltransferase